jgi:hypothetical protein
MRAIHVPARVHVHRPLTATLGQGEPPAQVSEMPRRQPADGAPPGPCTWQADLLLAPRIALTGPSTRSTASPSVHTMGAALVAAAAGTGAGETSLDSR